MQRGVAPAEPSRRDGADGRSASRAKPLTTWLPGSLFLRLTAACRRNFQRSSGGGDSSSKRADFLQCLPQDIVLDILSRIPRSQYGSIRAVSRAGRAAISSRELYETRAATCRLQQLLFVLTRQSAGGCFRAYDPQRDKWRRVPPMPKDAGVIHGFACAAAAGKLLVMGGARNVTDDFESFGERVRSNRFVALDDLRFKDVSRRVWAFDAATWSWSEVAAMHEARYRAAAAVVGNRFVYVCGGQGQSSFLSSAEVYDVEMNTWWQIRAMHSARCGHRTVSIGGKLLAIAGEARFDVSCPDAHHNHSNHPSQQQQEQQQSGSAKLSYNSCSNPSPQEVHASKAAAVAAAAAAAATAAAMGNTLCPVLPNFGRRKDIWPGASMEVYDPLTDDWSLLPDSWFEFNKDPCPTAVVNERLYAVCPGMNVWVLDPASQQWCECGYSYRQTSTCRSVFYGSDCVELCGRLVIFGGVMEWGWDTMYEQKQLETVYAWQLPQGETATADMPDNLREASASYLKLEELAPMAGIGGHVLAAATVAF